MWQHYLRAWEVGGVVACLRNRRIFSTATDNLAVRKDFYAVKELSPLEVAFVRKYGVESTNPVARGINENWLRLFLYPFEVRRRLEARGFDPTDAAKAVAPLVSNAEEDLHAFIEGRSSKHLTALREGDLAFLQTDGDGRREFLHYLCIQYFRTSGLEETIADALRGAPGVRGNHVWQVLRHCYGTVMAMNLARKWPQLRVRLLRPVTGSEFITSDQPVINLHAVNMPRFDEVEELALYYPVSPTNALLIEEQSSTPQFDQDDLHAEQVLQLNRDMHAMCHEQVFGTSESQLQSLIV